jgi:hypothetical protein
MRIEVTAEYDLTFLLNDCFQVFLEFGVEAFSLLGGCAVYW